MLEKCGVCLSFQLITPLGIPTHKWDIGKQWRQLGLHYLLKRHTIYVTI